MEISEICRMKDLGLSLHSIHGVRHLAKEWQLDYNHERPHEALGFVPPAEYA